MRHTGKFSLTVALALMVSAQTAGADGWRLALPIESLPNSVTEAYARSPFYIKPTYEHQWRSLGRFQAHATSPTNPLPLFVEKVHVNGPQPGLAFGMRLPDSWAPPWAGRNLRLELSGSWFSLESEKHTAFPRIANTRFASVGGGPLLNTGGTNGFDFRAEATGFETALRIASDIAVWPNLVLTPSAGFFGGASLTRYRLIMLDGAGICANARAPCFQDTVNERVNARDIGGTFSLAARYAVHSGTSLTLGGGVSIVHTHARLTATECFDGTFAADGCQAALSRSASASLNRWGYRLFAQAGVGFDLGFARIDISGGIRYISVVPEVRNPSTANQTAFLSSSGQVGYMAQLRVSVPLQFFRF